MKHLDIPVCFVLGFTASALLLLFILLPYHTNTAIWEHYRLLAVPAEIPQQPIIRAVRNTGITGIVSDACLQDRFSFLTAQYYKGFPFTSVNEYKKWFTDEKSSLQYIYIPYKSLWQYIKVYFSVRKTAPAFYLEPPLPFALFQLCGCFILAVYCIANIKRKALFSALAFPFVLFAATAHGSFSMAAAVLSIFSAAYWIEALGGEADIQWKQFKQRITRNRFMFLLPLGAVLFAILEGGKSFLFFTAAIFFACISLLLVYRFLQLYSSTKEHLHFKMFVMHPDSWLHFWNTLQTYRMTVGTAVLILITAVFPLILPLNRLPHTMHRISVPAPGIHAKTPFTADGFFTACIQRSDFSLPDLAAYIEDHWYAAALPYTNLHEPFKPVSKHAAIRFTSFTQQPDGKLLLEEKVLLTFNSDFIANTLHNKALAALPLETMLLAQNGFLTAAHRQLKLFTFNSILTCCITLAALFFPCILIIMAKRQ